MFPFLIFSLHSVHETGTWTGRSRLMRFIFVWMQLKNLHHF